MGRRRTFLILAGAAVVTLGGWALSQTRVNPVDPPSITAVQLLSRPIPAGASNGAQLQHGRDVVIEGDCVSCHTRNAGEPMAGGLGMQTPFGVIYSPNITPDNDTGIGRWTPEQFYRAMSRGIDAHGQPLYPAFPYVYFTRLSRQDTDAALAYLKTIPPVRYTPPGNRLPFPLNIRFLVNGWNLLFFRPAPFRGDPTRSAQWNRGAFLVTGPGHCGQCHTPANFLGANENDRAFQSGSLENWVAPDLTGNPRKGLGSWNAAEIMAYLQTGRNDRAQAGGPMAEVVSYSTSLMSEADLAAIATYLGALPASPDRRMATPDAAAMSRGGAVYSDACASCHLEGGVGQPGFFPPLGRDAVLQQDNPAGLVHLILAGVRTAPTVAKPSPMSMPSFAWKLTDQEVADVSTFIRNSWGNRRARSPPARSATFGTPWALRMNTSPPGPAITPEAAARRFPMRQPPMLTLTLALAALLPAVARAQWDAIHKATLQTQEFPGPTYHTVTVHAVVELRQEGPAPHAPRCRNGLYRRGSGDGERQGAARPAGGEGRQLLHSAGHRAQRPEHRLWTPDHHLHLCGGQAQTDRLANAGACELTVFPTRIAARRAFVRTAGANMFRALRILRNSGESPRYR